MNRFGRSQVGAPHIHRGYYFPSIFADVLLEVNRALDNLNKSGKLFSLPSRRDSMPVMGGARAFSDFGAYGINPNELGYSDHQLQILVWAEYHNSGTTPSVTLIRSGLTLARTSKTSTPTSDTNQDQTKQSRCCRPSAAWLRSVSVSSAITTRSSSTTGVG